MGSIKSVLYHTVQAVARRSLRLSRTLHSDCIETARNRRSVEVMEFRSRENALKELAHPAGPPQRTPKTIYIIMQYSNNSFIFIPVPIVRTFILLVGQQLTSNRVEIRVLAVL